MGQFIIRQQTRNNTCRHHATPKKRHLQNAKCVFVIYVYIINISIYQYITHTHISTLVQCMRLIFQNTFSSPRSCYSHSIPSRNYHPSSDAVLQVWRWAQGAKPVRTPWKSVPFEAGRWQKGCWIGGCLGVLAPFWPLKCLKHQT